MHSLKIYNLKKKKLGEDFQEIYGLNEANIYDPTVNPSTSLEFSSAGSRVLHAIIPVEFKYVITTKHIILFSLLLCKYNVIN